MKQFFVILVLWLTAIVPAVAQHDISGTVQAGRRPLAGVNIYIKGTLDGCRSDSLGRFRFSTDKSDSLILRATCIGYDAIELTLTADAKELTLQMHRKSVPIDEVVVTASSFMFGKTQAGQSMNSIDVVTTGSSCGDLVAALQSLPGSQRVDEDGKLYVRGGSSEECQTFINGMHVLEPYSSEPSGSAVRGRYSPFLFKGINFSSGGYLGEWGQALSSVITLETTDQAESDKLGVSASLLDWNAGGTKAFASGSLSANLAYTSLAFYDRLFPNHRDWTRPWRNVATEAQYKKTTKDGGIWKSYLGYDLTSFGLREDQRSLSLAHHNLYLNSTYRTSLTHNRSFFLGAAQSVSLQDIKNAVVSGDRYGDDKTETHLKARFQGTLSDRLAWTLGAEVYGRYGRMNYDTDTAWAHAFNYFVPSLHADGKLRVAPRLFSLFSVRTEWTSFDHRFMVEPRLSVQWMPLSGLNLSVTAGRYSQVPEDDLMHRSDLSLRQSTADHAIVSAHYERHNFIARVEAYAKRYRHLPLLTQKGYASDGKGKSKGVDVYTRFTIANTAELALSYSYCDATRHWLDYEEEEMPPYLSRHNLRVNLRCPVGKWIFSLTESFASHRHVDGRDTPNYNSLDAAVTWLASKKVIVYGSVTNLLNRKYVYGWKDDTPVVKSQRQFFYLGIFITLKGNKAYDISNF